MKNISAKYIGLITGGLMVFVSLIMFYQFHYPDTGMVKYVCLTVYAIGIFVSLFNFKNNNKEGKDLKDFFSEGFKTFVVVCLIMSIFTWLFYKNNPQIFEKAIEEINKINALDTDKTPAEVIENGNRIRNIKLPMTVALNTIMYMVLGALVSLLGAGILSQKKLS
jgi:multisubunit Na+/H+ antiporter MnhB subunit